MNAQLAQRLEHALGSAVQSAVAVAGGNIATTQRIDLADRRSVFVKTGGNGFLQEANGLRELARAEAIRIPEVLHAEPDLLVLEHIATAPPPADFMANFGRAFAELHQHTTPHFGFVEDNFIGATRQLNVATGNAAEDWPTFYWTHRLEPQTRLAADAGFDLADDMNALARRLPELLAGSEEPPRLLHGDLWSGNFLCDEAGAPVLIDPAVYYGHREADLGMTHLFGGFSAGFYQAYEEAAPLPSGSAERRPLYMLYHVLNHLNLFGGSYAGQARRIMRSYL